MQTLIAISDALNWVISRIGKLAAWILLPLMGVIILDVVTRKFGLLISARDFFLANGMEGMSDFIGDYLTSTKFQELEWHFHAALFLLCLGFGYLHNSHVRIEIVRERFSIRLKAWLEVIGILIFLFPYAGLVLYFGYDFAHRSFGMNEVSASLTGLSHRWVIKAFVPIGMVLLLIGAIGVLLRNLVFLFGDQEMVQQAYNRAVELHSPDEELHKLRDSGPGDTGPAVGEH